MQEAERLYSDACNIIEQARAVAYRAVNEVLIKRNWLLGMRIQLEVLKDKRAEYGERIIKELASALTAQYGKGFTWRNLYNYIDFYQKHEVLFQVKTVSDSDSTEILHAVSAKSGGESAQSIMHAMSAKLDKETGNNFQGHNPTIGILLCADTDEDVAHYSVLNGNDQLFAAKYLTYMPTKEELRREIEQQKEFFRLQNG